MRAARTIMADGNSGAIGGDVEGDAVEEGAVNAVEDEVWVDVVDELVEDDGLGVGVAVDAGAGSGEDCGVPMA